MKAESTLGDGVELIAAERRRQVQAEGWTTEHDDQHDRGEMAQAAACYAWPPPRSIAIKGAWPWDRHWWKPENGSATKGPDRIRTLVKAGALIAAEIDRLQRATSRRPRVRGELLDCRGNRCGAIGCRSCDSPKPEKVRASPESEQSNND